MCVCVCVCTGSLWSLADMLIIARAICVFRYSHHHHSLIHTLIYYTTHLCFIPSKCWFIRVFTICVINNGSWNSIRSLLPVQNWNETFCKSYLLCTVWKLQNMPRIGYQIRVLPGDDYTCEVPWETASGPCFHHIW